ncbi:MAG: hypothetical protein RIQ47_1648 [Bacteroidota bacterium]|jgi:predicted Rossmann fold flavoprotein
MRIAIIGGGAAGFFAAIAAKEAAPEHEVVLIEATSKVLSKVRISGGGRCNVTHACFDARELVQYYPRGGKELRQAFSRFMPGDTISWFEERGVDLKTEEDGRMFPVSDDSTSIVDCLMSSAQEAGVMLRLSTSVRAIHPKNDKFILSLSNDNELIAHRLLIATGGSPKLEGFDWIASLGHTIVPPVPSLFTFNIPKDPITQLMGVSVENAFVQISASNFSAKGPLLITHWGLSGPAVLKLSSLAARWLAEKNYNFEVIVNWMGEADSSDFSAWVGEQRKERTTTKVLTTPPQGISKRLWEFLLHRAGIRADINWSDLRRDESDSLQRTVLSDCYSVKGKTTFKEEFVTCGGVSLKEIDFKTMQSKIIPHLFFAGEVLDIDAVTGGFNFQAAWTTGFIAGNAMIN